MQTRRDFLQKLAAITAGAAIIPTLDLNALAKENAALGDTPGSTPGSNITSGGGKDSVVAVAKGKDYEKIVQKVVQDLGGISKFVKKGDKVVVKPNIGWDRSVEQAANTHPLVVVALVKLALEAGAKQVQVFDRSCNDPRRCYANSGIQKAVEAIGDSRVKCEYMDARKWVKVKLEKGKSITEFEFYKDAIECDCYINAPIAKHHGSARLTMGLKNAMGVIGGNRGDIHKDLGQRIADINLVLPHKLTVIDATRILTNHGPQGGNVDDVKVLDTVIASTDIVAADAYATTLFGKKPEDIPSTVAGFNLGLGQMDLTKVKVMGA
jgi:uncharacterized protein (DUF362 family)